MAQDNQWVNRIVHYGVMAADQFTANPRNPRRHPQTQRDAVKGSLDTLGFIAPVIVNRQTGYLIDGHERVMQALDLGDDTPVPFIEVDLTEEEEALALASFDWITQMATYDKDALDDLLQSIDTDNAALQALLDQLATENNISLDDAPPMEDMGGEVDRADELREKWQTAKGQLWIIPSKTGKGVHRLLCGDSTNAADVARLMDGEKAQGCFTSPPYAEQRKEQYGGIPVDDYVSWWGGLQVNIRKHLCSDGSLFINIKPHSEDYERVLYVFDLVCAMKRAYQWLYIEEYAWTKQGLPRDPHIFRKFKDAFEPVYHFTVSKHFAFYPEHVTHHSVEAGRMTKSNPSLGKHQGKGKVDMGIAEFEGQAYPSNVLYIPAGATTEDTGAYHPASFPVDLPSFFLRAFSRGGDIWFDPFMGSGSTLIACEQTSRIGYGMEISESYCAVILERLSAIGLTPRLDTPDTHEIRF